MSKPKFPRWFQSTKNSHVVEFVSTRKSVWLVCGERVKSNSFRLGYFMANPNWRELTEDEAKAMMNKEKGGV